MEQFIEYIITAIKKRDSNCSSDDSTVEEDSKEPVKEITEDLQVMSIHEAPPPLFYTKDETHRQYVKVLKKIFTEPPSDRLHEPRPMFHISNKLNPVSKLQSLPFHPHIIGAFEQLQFCEPLTIQTYLWPALLRGYSACVVAPGHSNKTMSYIPILCNHVLSNNSSLPDDNSPIVLVICPKVATVEKVKLEFELILKSTPKKECIQMFTHRINVKLEENIDIVITTPNIFVDLSTNKILPLNRLCYVVLENADEITTLFWEETLFLMEKMEEVIKKRNNFISIQIITISEKWCANLEKFSLMLRIPPAILINDHIEASYYGRTKIKFHFVQPEYKGYKIIEILERNLFRGYKTVILCDSITQRMLDYLDVHGVIYYLVTEKTDSYIVTRWSNLKRGSYFAMVCTDEIFKNKLAITDAEIIIQYSLPANMDDFSFRFSGFVDNYDNISETEPSKMRKNAMHILIDNNDFDTLLQVFEKLYAVFDEEYLVLYKYLKNEVEKRKVNNNVILCENYLLYEGCNGITCPYRHILNKELDVDLRLPRKGLIGVKILYFESPIKLICRINHIHYCFKATESWEVPDKYEEIAKKLDDMKYILTPIDKRDMKAGMRCVAEMELRQGEIRGRMERGKIMLISKDSPRILVKFVDVGLKKYVDRNQIYYIPDSIKEYIDQTVTIYIEDIMPPDMDVSWPKCFNTWLDNEVHKYKTFVCPVGLQISEGIFVYDLYPTFEPGKIHPNCISVCYFLSKLGIVKNKNHINFLYDLCRESNVPLNDLEFNK